MTLPSVFQFIVCSEFVSPLQLVLRNASTNLPNVYVEGLVTDYGRSGWPRVGAHVVPTSAAMMRLKNVDYADGAGGYKNYSEAGRGKRAPTPRKAEPSVVLVI